MNRTIPTPIPRARALFVFMLTTGLLFGSLLLTARAQPPAPDSVTLRLDAATTSGLPNVAYLGQRITYTLRITNSGNTTLQNVLLIDDLPRDTLDEFACGDCEYQTESQTFPDPLGGTITVTVTRRISWTVPTLGPGQVTVKSFSARVVGQPDGEDFTNRAFAYYVVGGVPATVNSNDNIVTARVQIPQDGNIALSSAATWFSDDFGGTLSQDWGDFDRDGDLDLILGSSVGTTIYRNDEGVLNRYWSIERTAFGVRWLDSGSPNFSFVAVGASVDGTAVTTGTNIIYTYNPTSTNAATRFLEVDTFRSDLQLIRVEPGDVNQDGWVDLVATTNAINAPCPTQLYLHTQDPAAPYPDGRSACASSEASAAISLGDVDNDSDLDLASGRFASQDATLLFNTMVPSPVISDVIFTDTNSVSIESGLTFLPYDFSWGDFDNDGLLDLAAAFPLEREARVYRNLGGEFAQPVVIRTAAFRTPLSVDWGDFDNDGVLELAVAGATPRIYRVFADGTVEQMVALPPNALPTGAQVWSIRGVDQDNDSDLDLALSNRDGPSQIFTVFAPFLDPEMVGVDNTPASSVAWGDADGDGTQDLLLGAGPPSTNGFGTRLYYNQGGRFQPNQSDQITGFGPHRVAFGDVNRDGRLDIAIGTTAQTQVFLAGQLTTPAWTSPSANVNNALAWGDYDHDGDLDLLVGSAQASLLYRKHGALLQNQPAWVSQHASDNTRAVAWADFDGDKLLDFVLGNDGQPGRLYRNTPLNEFEEVAWSPPTVATRALAWGDYDSDGDLDLAVAAYGGSVLLFANLTVDASAPEPTLSDTPYVLPASNHYPTALAWGDWDNDGDLDLAVGNDNHRIKVFANQTRNPETPSFAWVWASALAYRATGVAWGDYDNDGDLDLAASQDGALSNGLFVNGLITPSHLRDFETTIPLPDNNAYVQVERPGQTDDAFFHSAPEILSGPTAPAVPIRYRVYDPDGSRDPTVPNPPGDGIARTIFEYSLDGGGSWQSATPAVDSPPPITATARLGVEGLFLWDAQSDEAISDHTLFRVRAIPVTRSGSRSRGSAVAVSAPFRVRGTTCQWPLDAAITMSPTNPIPGQQVRFVGSIGAGTGVMSYTWDFGDGATAQGQTVYHTYGRADFFDLLLTVTGPPCPINFPAYAEVALTVGDPVVGPDTFLPLIARSVSAGEPEPRPEGAPPAAAEAPATSPFRPMIPAVRQATAARGGENLCLSASQVSSSPFGVSNQPVMSSNGARIAFWSTGNLTGSNSDGNIELFMWRRDTPATPFYQLTSSLGTILGGLNIAPSINAAGDRIAFYSDRNLTGGNGDGSFEIFVAAIGSTGSVQLHQLSAAPRNSSILPSISADGRRVAFVSDASGNSDIYVAELNANGSVAEVNPVVALPGVGSDLPVLSSDGQVVAFVSTANLSNGNPDGNSELFVAQDTGGASWAVRQVTFTAADVFNSEADLSADGRRLAFVSTGDFAGSNPEGNPELLVADLGASVEIRPITSEDVDVIHGSPSINDDGSRIAFISNADASGNGTVYNRVFLYDEVLDTYGEISQLGDSISGEAALNSTGDRVTFVSNEDGNREIFRLDCFVADVRVSASVAPSPLQAGSPLTYTFTVDNLGPNDAVTTTFTATIDEELLNVTVSPTSCLVSVPLVTCNLGTLGPGQNRTIRVRGTVPGDSRGTLTAEGVVETETYDRNPANDSTTLQTQVNAQVTLALNITDNPDPVTAGMPLTYTLLLQNQGPSTATSVEMSDTLPATYLAPTLVTGQGCSLVGRQLTCSYPALAPGSNRNVVIRGTVDPFLRNSISTSATADSAESNPVTRSASSAIQASVEMTASATIEPSPIQAGAPVTFTVTVANEGPSGGTSLVAQTTVPTDVTGITVSPAASCSVAGKVVTCTFPTIAPNTTRPYTIRGNVSAEARGTRQLRTTVSVAERPLPLIFSQPMTVEAAVDLDLTLSSTPSSPVAGAPLTYTFTVVNNGPATASDLAVTDTYSTLFNLSAMAPACSPEGGEQVVCRLTALAPAASETFTLTGSLEPSATGSLTNTAMVTALEVTTPVVASLNSTINADSSLVVTPTVSPAPLIAGDRVTYTLSILNLGPSDATNVVLTGTVTGLISPTVAGACGLNNKVYTCAFATLEPNQPVIVAAGGIIPPTARGTLENDAWLISDENPTPQVISLDRPITLDVDLTLNLVADPAGDVFAGQDITYTLIASNNGRSTALDLTLADTFDYLDSPAASPGCTRNGEIFSCPLPGGLAMNETVELTVTGIISPSIPTPFMLPNDASLTWNEEGETFTDSVTSRVLPDIDFDIVLSPASSVQVTAGDPVTYSVAVTNTGDSAAPGVVVTGTLSHLNSPSVTVVGGAACPITSGIYSCTIGILSPHVGSGRVRINAMVNPTTRGTLTNTVTVSAQVSPTVSVNPLFSNPVIDDVALDIDARRDTATPQAGLGVTYSFGITNTGDSTALNVTVTDTLTKVITSTISFSASPGTCTVNDYVVTCSIPTLPKNSPATVTVSAQIDPAARGALPNSYSVASPDVPTTNGTLPGTITASATLATSVTAAGTVTAGLPYSYTVTLTNNGPSTATSTRLTGTLASLVAPIENSPNCTVTLQLLDCTVGTLGVNQSFNVMVSGTVTATARTTFSNLFRADALETPPATHSVTTSVTRDVDLALAMTSVPNGTVIAGDAIRYSVTLTNTGVSAALSSVLTASTSSLITSTLVMTPASGCALGAGGVIQCVLGTLLPNATRTLSYEAQVDPSKRGTLTNSAGLTEIDRPVPLTASKNVTVNAQADLVVHATTNNPVIAGGPLTYTVFLTNSGPSTAMTVTLTGTLNVIQSPSVDGAGCTQGTGVFTCTLASLLPNDPYTATVTGLVPGTRRSAINNTFRALSTEDASAPKVLNTSVTSNVSFTVDIHAAGVITSGAPITLTTHITNTGTSTALTGTYTYTYANLAAGPVGTVSDIGGTCVTDHPAQQVVCTFGSNFTGGTNGTVTIVGTMAATLPATINHSGEIAASNPTVSTTEPLTLTRGNSYPVALTLFATGVITNSQPLTYTIRLDNNAADPAASIRFTDTYPAYTVTPTLSVSGQPGSCVPNHAARRVVCTFPTLAPGSTATVFMRGTLTNSVPSTVTNNVLLRVGTPPLSLNRSLSLPRNSSTPLRLNITATGTVTNSSPITYTLHMTNIAPVPVGTLVVTDSYTNKFSSAPTATIVGQPGNCAVSHAQRRVICSLPGMPPFATARIRIVGTLDNSGLPPTIDNSAILRSATPNLTISDSLTLNLGSTYLVEWMFGGFGLWWLLPLSRRPRKPARPPAEDGP